MDSNLLFSKVPVEFLFGGKATFTVLNGNRDKSYTFQINHAEGREKEPGNPAAGKWPERWFAKLLTGSDNTSDYTLFGMVDRRTGLVTLTQKVKARGWTLATESVRVLQFVTVWAVKGEDMPGGIVLQAPTHCGRCNRLLTAPRERNPYWPWLGPECGTKV
jgi:hypothetical protein